MTHPTDPPERKAISMIKERMIRAAKLDPGLYEEVEADRAAMGQATVVVVLSGLAAGIGHISTGGLSGVLGMTIAALLGWYLWAFLTYFIGTRLLAERQTQADYGQLLRTLGFSSAPGVIRVLGVIPPLAPFVFLIAAIWMLAAMVIAVRQALDYTSTLRAAVVCLLGWIIQAVFLMTAALLFGPS